MGKNVSDKLLLILVIAASIAFTWYVSDGVVNTMIYNFAFLGIMILISLIGMLTAFGRMGRYEDAFWNAVDEIDKEFGGVDAATGEECTLPENLFRNKHLDHRFGEFMRFMKKSQSGLVDIEDYINEDIMDDLAGKKKADMIPDILTSIGILGTFIGLVVGLKNFEPSNYEAMTNSVASLVDGIKVAFLTSIYGIALSLVFSYGLKSAYVSMQNSLNAFLDKFHNLVLPSAEAEARNIMVNSQEEQTQAILKMSEQFSQHLATSFEKVITPSFRKMNQSMDILTATLSQGQEELMKGLLNDFLTRMNANFKMEFDHFSEALEAMTTAQDNMIEGTKNLFFNTASQLHSSFEEENLNMKNLVRELGSIQKEYLTTTQEVIDNNQRYSDAIDQNYRQVIGYLQEAEQSSAKFWVACNQAMQNYVSAATNGVESFNTAMAHNASLYEANEQVVESYNMRMQEFIQYQKLTAQTMEQVQNLLYNIVTSPDETNKTKIRQMAINNSNKDLLMEISQTLKEQSEKQEELLQTILEYLKENSRSNRKNRGIFG